MYKIITHFCRSQFARPAKLTSPLLNEAHSFAGRGNKQPQPLVSPLTCAPLPLSPPRLLCAEAAPAPASPLLTFQAPAAARSSLTLAQQLLQRAPAAPPTLHQSLSRSFYASTHPIGQQVGPYAVYNPAPAPATGKYSNGDSAFGSGVGFTGGVQAAGGSGGTRQNYDTVGASGGVGISAPSSNWYGVPSVPSTGLPRPPNEEPLFRRSSDQSPSRLVSLVYVLVHVLDMDMTWTGNLFDF